MYPNSMIEDIINYVECFYNNARKAYPLIDEKNIKISFNVSGFFLSNIMEKEYQ